MSRRNISRPIQNRDSQPNLTPQSYPTPSALFARPYGGASSAFFIFTQESMTDRQPRPSPFCLRLTPEERARLERDAAGMSLAAYIKWRVFDPNSPPPRTRGKAPVRDHQTLSRLMGMLGQSRLSSNLNQLARAANSGSLPADDKTCSALERAAHDIAEMRAMLMQALGMRGE